MFSLLTYLIKSSGKIVRSSTLFCSLNYSHLSTKNLIYNPEINFYSLFAIHSAYSIFFNLLPRRKASQEKYQPFYNLIFIPSIAKYFFNRIDSSANIFLFNISFLLLLSFNHIRSYFMALSTSIKSMVFFFINFL